MIKGEDKIDYGYLNLDTKEFTANQSELVAQIGKGGTIRAIPNYDHGQILVVASNRPFTELEAILTCRRITGMMGNND